MESLDVHLLTEIVVRAQPSVHWLCASSVVSRKWRTACSSSLLWQNVVIDGERRGNVYGEGVERIANRCKHTRSLHIFNIHIFERPNPWIHHSFEIFLTSAGVSLEVLKLSFAWELPFTDKLLYTVGRGCPSLREFELSAANYFMTDSAVSQFLRACPRVLHFSCYVRSPLPIHSPGDTLLWQIAKKWPQLQSLEINGHHLTENGIFGLEDCVNLKKLSLHGYKRGTFDRAKTTAEGRPVIFETLEEVCFTYDLPLASELRRLLHMCPNIRMMKFTANAEDAHAENLVNVIRVEFPHITSSLQYLADIAQEYSLLGIASQLGVMIDKY